MYVTGAAILTQVGKTAPTAADTTWADLCAAAVDAEITHMLDGMTVSAGMTSELARSALLDGIGAYAGRDAPTGVLALGPDGQAVRTGAEILRASRPVLNRYTLPGIG